VSKDLYEIFKLNQLQEVIPKGSIWRHKKTENLYMVKDLVVMESDLQVAVAYSGVTENSRLTWVRPLAEFMDGCFERVTLFKDELK
jgi:hypothetical protein